MADTMKDPRAFFSKGTPEQFEYVLGLYDDAIKLKASQKNRKEEEYLKLDKWYQKELPKKIEKRGKDAHLTHEELVMCMKWKLWRSKYSPRLKDLIQMNTPRLCMAETKKAFRALQKKQDLSSAIQALCNLKGVGPAMASVVLTAGSPKQCGFMADECLMAIPEIEGIDYTTKELINFVDQLTNAADRLNKDANGEFNKDDNDDLKKENGNGEWNPHRVEMALWTHYVISELKKELLNSMPEGSTENGGTETTNGENGAPIPEESNDSIDSATANKENLNTNGTSEEDSRQTVISNEEDSRMTDDSRQTVISNEEDSRQSVISHEEDTNDSVPISEGPSESCDVPSPSQVSINTEDEDTQEPNPKKQKVDE